MTPVSLLLWCGLTQCGIFSKHSLNYWETFRVCFFHDVIFHTVPIEFCSIAWIISNCQSVKWPYGTKIKMCKKIIETLLASSREFSWILINSWHWDSSWLWLHLEITAVEFSNMKREKNAAVSQRETLNFFLMENKKNTRRPIMGENDLETTTMHTGLIIILFFIYKEAILAKIYTFFCKSH